MIEDLFVNESAEQIVDIKVTEVVKIDFVGTYTVDDIMIEIQSVEQIDGGVQVFARAWNGKQQLGFGPDGTVEIERFRVFNPPILVDDPNGTVIRTYTDIKGVLQKRTLREDPKQALVDCLKHTILVSGKTDTKIVTGSVGNTTDTFFSGPGDGMVQNNSTVTAWATLRAAASGTVFDYTGTINGTAGECYDGVPTNYEVLRHFFPFDTSSLPDTDVVSSATLTIFSQSWTGTAENVGIVQTSQASNTQLSTADFNTCGALNTPTEGATRQTPSSTDTTANDFVLNASGISWISTTGYTNLGMRTASDIDNVDPVLTRHYFSCYDSDQSGTSLDPKLVVVHAAPAVTAFIPTLLTLGVGL